MSLARDRSRARGRGGAAAGFTPAALSGLVAWWRADLGVTLNGSDVSAWADQAAAAPSGDATQGTAANQPGYNAADAHFAAQPSLTLAPTKRLTTATAADWTFLHNGTDMTIAAVVYPRASHTGWLLSTNSSGAGTALGIGLLCVGQEVRLQLGNGTDSVVEITSSGTALAAAAVHDVICTYRSGSDPDALVWVDGVSVGTMAEAAAPSATDPPNPLRLGGLNGATNGFDGEVREIVVYNRALAAAELTPLRAYLRTRQGY